MRRNSISIFAAIALISAFGASTSRGSEIFHWVDEDGVPNFSDWAPRDSGVEVSKLTVSDTNSHDYDPAEDHNSILDQAERMNARWEILKERQEQRRKEREERARHQHAPQYVEYDYPYHAPGYFFRPFHAPVFGHARPFVTPKRQLFALDQLRLLARPRPHSINSSAHLVRINAGKSLQGGVPPQVSHFQER